MTLTSKILESMSKAKAPGQNAIAPATLALPLPAAMKGE